MKPLLLLYLRLWLKSVSLVAILMVVLAVIFILLETSPNYWESGFPIIIFCCALLLFSGVVGCGQFNTNWELTLPFSRKSMLVARLFMSYLFYTFSFLVFFGVQVWVTTKSVGDLFVYNYPWKFINLLLAGFISLVFYLNIYRHFNFSPRNWLKGSFQFLIYLVLTFFALYYSVFPPYEKYYLVTIGFVILGFLFYRLILSKQLEGALELLGEQKKPHKLSLLPIIDSFVIEPIVKLNLNFRFMKTIKVTTITLWKENFGVQGVLLLVLTLMLGLTTIISNFIYFFVFFNTVSILLSPYLIIKKFGFMPINRKHFFRMTFLPKLVLVIVALGGSVFLLSKAEINKESKKYSNLYFPKETYIFDSIFNEYVFLLGNKRTGVPFWLNNIFGIEPTIKDDNGYEKKPNTEKPSEFLKLSTFDPYTFGPDDPSTFAAYQFSRYLKNNFGLNVSTNEAIVYWQKNENEKDIKNVVLLNKKLVSTATKNTTHVDAIINFIESHRMEINESIIKVRIAFIMLTLSFVFLALYFNSSTRSKIGVFSKKTINFMSSLISWLFILVLFSNCLDPVFNPISHLLTWVFVQYFSLCVVGFFIISVFLYFKIESNFKNADGCMT